MPGQRASVPAPEEARKGCVLSEDGGGMKEAPTVLAGTSFPPQVVGLLR